MPSTPPAVPSPLPCTGARLRRLTRRVTVLYEHHLRPLELRLTQYSLLMHLGSAPQSVLELADRMEMDRTTLTRGLRPLLARGWAIEVRGRDARMRLFVLSSEGTALRERAAAHWAEAQRALESAIGREFARQLNHCLEDALVRLKPALPEEN